jgi:hypothetical protein
MTKGKRNLGREILQGLREIKGGRHGRVVNLPSVASIREKTGSHKNVLQHYSEYRYGHYRTGSKDGELRRVPLARCF